ncbi:uncharacterized protein LOC110423495 [Herrania umbratica]|uniref:Uncharacterized protein LOC110423495 n=1 Tax=Herrania umbratica TaxID=108875 RepID=A0A6J1B437_9ROSI|nr:uncharacterized protein LOC110423495 [Herrania umbratica]
MGNDESVQGYAVKVLNVVNRLRLLGENVSEKRIVNKLLQGHVEKVCKNRGAKVEEKAIVVEQKDQAEKEVLFMVRKANNDEKKDTCLLDNRCSNYLTSYKEKFIMIDDSFITKMEIGNGDVLLIYGAGTIRVQTPTSLKSISNVFYMSVGQLVNENFELSETNEDLDENVDKAHVRETKSWQDIYSRYYVAITESSSYVEAVADGKWRQAMEAKMPMIRKNQTWILVDKLDKQKFIGVKWVYKTKLNSNKA